MHNLIPITALGGTKAQVDTIGDLTIAECPDWALASVSARVGKTKTLATAFKKVMGIGLPKPAQSTTLSARTAFWVGPEQYFVEAPFGDVELLADTLAKALKNNASVTEQTDGWVRFDLNGPHCSDVFERLCGLDTRALKTGVVSRTILEHLGCFILRRADTHFSVFGPRSSAGSLHHALVASAKSALG